MRAAFQAIESIPIVHRRKQHPRQDWGGMGSLRAAKSFRLLL